MQIGFVRVYLNHWWHDGGGGDDVVLFFHSKYTRQLVEKCLSLCVSEWRTPRFVYMYQNHGKWYDEILWTDAITRRITHAHKRTTLEN